MLLYPSSINANLHSNLVIMVPWDGDAIVNGIAHQVYSEKVAEQEVQDA